MLAEFCLTFGFMSYDIFKNQPFYDATPIVYWVGFLVTTIVALLNNIHGYFILKTTQKTFNSKSYFIIRILLQLIVWYVGIAIVLGKNFKWHSIGLPPGSTDPIY